MSEKKEFILRYGNGKAIRDLVEQINMLDSGEKHLILDSGEVIKFNYSQPHGMPREIAEKFGEFGVRKVIKTYTHDEIYIGELTDEQKKYK